MRWTRVIAITTVLGVCAAPAVVHADDPSATRSPATSSATRPTTSGPTVEVPDPLAITPSALSRLTALALRYQSNLTVAEERRTEATERTADADTQLVAARAYVAQVVDYAMSPSADPFAQKLTALAGADGPDDLITGVFSTEQVTEAQEGHLHDAKRAFDRARVLQAKAAAATRAAESAEQAAAGQLRQLSALAEDLGLGSSSTPTGLPETQTEQQNWNSAGLNRWRAYTAQVARLRITPPPASAVRGTGGVQQVTVGSTTVDVLPRETVTMIDTVLGRLGDDYADKNGRAAWSCGGLMDVTGAYALRGTPAQLYATTVAVDATTMRPGDLVFSANAASGIHHVGLYIGDGQMVDAPATRHQVGVSAVPAKPFAVTRPSLGPGTNRAPVGTAKPATTVCNATTPAPPKRQPWTFPLKQGTYSVSAGFGQSSSLWATTHTGQDLAAPTGTPIYASRGGTVSLEEIGWAGTLITISHDDGTAERYAHSSAQLVQDGQVVKAGDEIALVGSRGNTTGPHLHFEITVNGQFIDPMPVLAQTLANTGAGTGWGGYGNGQIPRGVLCPVGDVLLRCDVAVRARALAAGFAARFGRTPAFTAGYRDVVGQIQRGADGNLLDIPGTSPFGWGTRFGVAELPREQSVWLARRARALGLTAQGPNTWSLGS